MTKPCLLILATAALGVAAVRPVSPMPPPAVELTFTGMCDASAGLFLDANHLLVANDEDRHATELRIYDIRRPGPAIRTVDATAALAPQADTQGEQEVDLEGLTRFGTRWALIGSHSRQGDAALPAPNRRRLLAFELTGTPPDLALATPRLYTALVEDAQRFLATQPEPLKSLTLDRDLASKAGGLSIEALAETKTGELLIGLRSPLGPGGDALILVLENAAAVLDARAPASFATPIRLDLHKQGLRDLVSDGKGGYLLLAGAPGETDPPAQADAFSLWSWAGPGAAAPRQRTAIANDPGTSAEGIAITPDLKTAWILFDEGERKTTSGKKCKGDSVPADVKSFRARPIDISGF